MKNDSGVKGAASTYLTQPTADSIARNLKLLSSDTKAVYVLFWTVLARGKQPTEDNNRFPQPQLSVKRCNPKAHLHFGVLRTMTERVMVGNTHPAVRNMSLVS
ncbi:hypothetical protein [Fuerstiella marisgermanici]|uniref:Uncharacterized protein n=1 Tax=Fuerstiella marisgermanici TaxID=1891926 RepID=A0A1P8WM64_9PLAN|nr:hypothetical protein [Fuerstiella marisgermanici]APZ95137.1 hypothetical protein Fuma_04792 [Fuerstiella marisgermanici]